MYYNIDLTLFVKQLLPPILRNKVLMALMRVLITPLRYLYDNFLTYSSTTNGRLAATAHVQDIQYMLNREFCLTREEIYLEDYVEYEIPILYNQTEGGNTSYLTTQTEENTLMASMRYEPFACIKVWIPTFLCTSLENPDKDKYGWQYLNRIQQLVNSCKPAGIPIRMETYDYI